MGYALFAQSKQVVDSQLNAAQLQQTQRSDEQFRLATQSANLQRMLSSTKAAQTGSLKDKYNAMVGADQDARQSIQAEISAMQAQFDSELEAINNEIYEVSEKEAAIEMEVKRLDTVVSALQQRLQAVEQAEGQGIQNATPKFAGA